MTEPSNSGNTSNDSHAKREQAVVDLKQNTDKLTTHIKTVVGEVAPLVINPSHPTQDQSNKGPKI